jgi:lysophospholipase L1-like esterase
MSGKTKSFLIQLFILLVLMGLIAVGKFWYKRADYESTLKNQIWPTETPSATINLNSRDESFPTVLFIGDSRMAQWNLPTLTNYSVVNAGTRGFTSDQTAMVTPGLLEKFHPKIAVLEVGINDLKYLGLKPEMRSAIVSLVLSNVTTIATMCGQQQCKLYVLTTWPATEPDWQRWFIWNSTIDESVRELNASLQKLDEPAKGIRVIDLFIQAGLTPNPGMYSDTLHLKPETYEKLNPALENILTISP